MGSSLLQDKVERPVPLAEAPPKKHTRLYANYIRVIAAFAVVQMHSVGEFLFRFDPAANTEIRFLTADAYYSCLRWATPFFIMLSGMFMLSPSRDESTAQFLRKRISRVLIPFAFWSVVYLMYEYRDKIYFGEPIPWTAVWNKVWYEDVYFHLWFIPMITGMYLLTPVFRIFIKNAQRGDIEYFLVLAFSITALQHFITNLFVVKYIGWLGYIGFYVLGYYISTYPIAWKKIIYPLALLMPPLTAWGTWWLSTQAGAYDNKIFVYFSPNVVLMSFALFLFLKDVDWSTLATRYPRLNRAVARLAELSYGVYFIHILILEVLKNGYVANLHVTSDVFFNHPIHPAIGAFLQALMVVSLSVFSISLLSRVPVLNKWLM
ncbi:MAG: acyltransferase family protein [Saprospiraceae bacterium]|nr:acyltransferase family protein [Saprospiraceae bacterium]